MGCAISVAAATKFIQNRFFTPQKKPLTVELSSTRNSSIAKLATCWQSMAREKMEISMHSQYPLVQEWAQNFRDCYDTISFILININHPSRNNHLYLCKDRNNYIQGMMLVHDKKNTVVVEHLTTHPHNLRSPLNENELNRIQGVGSALLNAAEERARSLGKEKVSLISVDSARGFYLKNGYEDHRKCMVKYVSQAVQPIFDHAA